MDISIDSPCPSTLLLHVSEYEIIGLSEMIQSGDDIASFSPVFLHMRDVQTCDTASSLDKFHISIKVPYPQNTLFFLPNIKYS